MSDLKKLSKTDILSNLKIKDVLLTVAAITVFAAIVMAGYILRTEEQQGSYDFMRITFILMAMVVLSFSLCIKKGGTRLFLTFVPLAAAALAMILGANLRISYKSDFAKCVFKALFDVIIPAFGFTLGCAFSFGLPKKKKAVAAFAVTVVLSALSGAAGTLFPKTA